jgi:DNA-directed RNA polymerase subunit RPC12/RpoP
MGVLATDLPEWEGHKTGITCPCGGQLTTITDDFTIVAGDRIGPDEIVRCEQCGSEYDVDSELENDGKDTNRNDA